MKKLFYGLLGISILLSCNETEESNPPVNLEYENNLIELKQGTAVVSDTPVVEGTAPFNFYIHSLTNDAGDEFSDLTGIFIERELGVITIEDDNRLGADIYHFTINVTNDDGSALFEKAFSLTITAKELATRLIYPDDGLEINYDESFITAIPVTEGIGPFTFSFARDTNYDFISIDSSNGVISIADTEKTVGVYHLAVEVENEDGRVIFDNAFTFSVTSPFSNRADGFYLLNSNNNVSNLLNNNLVQGEDFNAKERAGLYYSYVYLEEGDYHLIEIESSELKNRYGGVMSIINDSPSPPDCGYNSYHLIDEVQKDGDAFSVENAGLFLVSYDETLAEIIYCRIEVMNAIGSATKDGWGSDQILNASAHPQMTTFINPILTLREGEWKLRFNCRWVIDRRLNSTDPDNGYLLPTYIGGTLNHLIFGSEKNFNVAAGEEGIFEINVFWTPENLLQAQLTRVADAPEIIFNPADYQFGVIGNITAGGWDTDQNMFYKGLSANRHSWLTIVTFDNASDGKFKFRANDSWQLNLGGNIEGNTINLSENGEDIVSPGAGVYYIHLSTIDEGATWEATIEQSNWSIIGEGGPSNSWETGTAMQGVGFSNGISTYSYSGQFSGGEFKFRANDSWDYNLGLSGQPDGTNLNLDSGNYEVKLIFDGENYSIEISQL